MTMTTSNKVDDTAVDVLIRLNILTGDMRQAVKPSGFQAKREIFISLLASWKLFRIKQTGRPKNKSSSYDVESPLLEMLPRRTMLSRIVHAQSRRSMVRNCINSHMKCEANLLAARFLHPMDRRSSPWRPRKSAKVKEENLW